MNDDMTVEYLADLQLKQAKTHRTALEGWDKISVDTFVFIIFLMYRIYNPTESDIGHKLKIEVSSLLTNSVVIAIESLPVIERIVSLFFSLSSFLHPSSSVDN